MVPLKLLTNPYAYPEPIYQYIVFKYRIETFSYVNDMTKSFENCIILYTIFAWVQYII